MAEINLEQPAAPTPAAAPQEPTLRDDVKCPLCDYDLRGLTEPRCPECGYRFVWSDLTDPARRLHPYLFEHHPRRNTWSFARTMLGGLRPVKFWISIHPAQPSRAGRLILYWCASVLPLAVALAGYYGLWFLEAAARAQASRTVMFNQYGWSPALIEEHIPLPPSPVFFEKAWREEGEWTTRLACFWFAWPWLVFVTLLLFRVSMRRARIRPAHVLRCVLYSCDAVAWLAVPVALAVGVRVLHSYGVAPPRMFVPPAPIPADHVFRYTPHFVTDTLFWGGLLLFPWTGYRLAIAFRRYLRFDHPVATVVAAYLISALFLMVAVARRWV